MKCIIINHNRVLFRKANIMNEIVLFKYLRNELSEDESLKVEAWYNSSDENK